MPFNNNKKSAPPSDATYMYALQTFVDNDSHHNTYRIVKQAYTY